MAWIRILFTALSSHICHHSWSTVANPVIWPEHALHYKRLHTITYTLNDGI